MVMHDPNVIDYAPVQTHALSHVMPPFGQSSVPMQAMPYTQGGMMSFTQAPMGMLPYTQGGMPMQMMPITQSGVPAHSMFPYVQGGMQQQPAAVAPEEPKTMSNREARWDPNSA
jgi:hypothetical protein